MRVGTKAVQGTGRAGAKARAHQLGLRRAACFPSPLGEDRRAWAPSWPWSCQLEAALQRRARTNSPSPLRFQRAQMWNVCAAISKDLSSTEEKQRPWSPALRRGTLRSQRLPVTPRCSPGQPRAVILGVSLFILNPTLAVGSDFCAMILCSAYKGEPRAGHRERAQNVSLLSRRVLCS